MTGALVFLFNLLLTVLTEGMAVLLFYRSRSMLYYSFLCNLLTNPSMNLLLCMLIRFFGAGIYVPAVLALEAAVVFVEAGVYRYLCGFGWGQMLRLSLCINALSFLTGVVIAVH